MFFEWKPGAIYDPVITLYIDADDEDQALNRAWDIGNKMAYDDERQNWPTYRRS